MIIDEAYIDFGGETALPLLKEYENLLVVRTYSKSRSLAGMRIGFAMGNKRLIQAMNDVKESINSYTMSQEAIRVGVAAIDDEEVFQQNLKKVIRTRERSKEELEKRGFIVFDSQTNFLFARHSQIPAEKLFDALRERRIYVRHFGSERIHNYLRITIGTDEQMHTLIKFLENYSC